MVIRAENELKANSTTVLVCHKPQMTQKTPHVMHVKYWKFQFLKEAVTEKK
jgi:hypothetical protein